MSALRVVDFLASGGGHLIVEFLRAEGDTYWMYSIWTGKLCRQNEFSLQSRPV